MQVKEVGQKYFMAIRIGSVTRDHQGLVIKAYSKPVGDGCSASRGPCTSKSFRFVQFCGEGGFYCCYLMDC